VTSEHRRIALACIVGTAVEYYDFYLYGTAASLVLGPLFFPTASPTVQVMSAYATFAVAFLARPFGGAFFAHFGDWIGRKSTLVAALLTMGLSTVLIGLLPGYAQIGWAAPALLCLLRFGQGVGLAGEWVGAALLAVESAPPGWRGRFGVLPQLGSPIGLIASNLVFLAAGAWLTPAEFKAWGWRIAFVLSLVLVAVGLWVRLKLAETPAFKAALEEAPPPRAPLLEMLRLHAAPLLGGAMAVLAIFAVFYLTMAFSLSYGVGVLKYDRQAVLTAQLAANLCMAAGLALSGWCTDRSSARTVMLAGYAGLVVAGLLLPPMMGASVVMLGGFLCLTLFCAGFVSGPLGLLLPSLFPTRVRYSGTAVAFNAGSILGGGLAPLVATALAAQGGLWPVGLYLSGLCALSFVALLALRSAAGRHL
jgi:MFS family permease